VLWIAAKDAKIRAAVYALAAAAVAMSTPVVRASTAIDRLPIWMQWYVRPAGEFTTFTLFPWAGFVFAGAATGALLAAVGDRQERRLLPALAVSGAVLIAVGLVTAAQPSIYRASSFWTSSPTWFAIRTGILMVALAACFGVERHTRDRTNPRTHRSLLRAVEASWRLPLAKMGRSSLFIYWIHVELVYGYASWLWRGRLPLWGTAVACAGFCVLMYGAVILRDQVVDSWRRIGPVQQEAS
jgi:uncharacterized membrane protein